MNLEHFTAYVRHQAEAEPVEDKRAAYRRALDLLEAEIPYQRTKQEVRKALVGWITQSSRKSLRKQGDEASPFLTQMLTYAHLRDVLNGHVAVVVPIDSPKDEEAQLSLWNEGSGEL